jgi:hypothetical protein
VIADVKAGKYKNQLQNWKFEVHPVIPFFEKKLSAGDWALKTIVLWAPHLAKVPTFCPFCPDGMPGWIPLPGQVDRWTDVPIRIYTMSAFMELVFLRYRCSVPTMQLR